MVDKPPKLITKVDAKILHLLLYEVAISRQPFVISIIPSKIEESCGGKILKIGASEVIITKKIAMIVPTEIMLSAESSTKLEIMGLSGYLVLLSVNFYIKVHLLVLLLHGK